MNIGPPAAGEWLSRAPRAFYSIACAICCLLIAATIGLSFSGTEPFNSVWEDSYMFIRYVDNLLKSGDLIWNLGGGHPTYGITSPYYLLLVLAPLRTLLPGDPILPLVLGSLLSALLALCAIGILIFLNSSSNIRGWLSFTLFLLSLETGVSLFSMHALSGMDTAFGVLWSALLLIAFSVDWQRPTRWTLLMIIVLSGATFGTRPDLLIFGLGVPLYLALGSSGPARVRMLAATAAIGALVVAQAAFAYVHFGTPVPLAFYAKSKVVGLYPGLTGYRFTAFREFASFALSQRLLLIVAGLSLVYLGRRSWAVMNQLDRAVLIASLVFAAYYLFAVTQIMQFGARFYFPLLGPVAYLSTRLINSALDQRQGLEGIDFRVTRLALVGLGFIIWGQTVSDILPRVQSNVIAHVRPFDIRAETRDFWSWYWYRLPEFSDLPASLKMATTEIGHVGILNENKVVFDMAGLNETRFALHRFDAAAFCRDYSPDLIFLPNPGYQKMLNDIISDPCFKSNYEFFTPEMLKPKPAMGLALLRKSNFYRKLREIAVETH